MKRALIIIGIVIVAAGIVAAGIFLRGGFSGVGTTGTGGTSGTAGVLPTIPVGSGNNADAGNGATNGNASSVSSNPNPSVTPGVTGAIAATGPTGFSTTGFTAISHSPVVDYAPTVQGVLIVDPSGNVIMASSSAETIIAQAAFGTLIGAWFSPDGKWLLAESTGSGAVAGSPAQWNVLNIAKKTWTAIGVVTTDMEWSATGDQLAYFVTRTSGSALTIYTPATGASKTVLVLASPDLIPHWASASTIVISTPPTALMTSDILNYSITKGVLTTLASNVPGADIVWSGNSGSGGLLLSSAASGGRLQLIDSVGTTNALTFLTMPNKCAFGGTDPTATSTTPLLPYLFCAIPQDTSILKSHVLPDDYLKGTFGTIDALYSVNLADGQLAPVVTPSAAFAFDAADLKINNNNLYFVNRGTERLYGISLAEFVSTETGD